MSMPNGFQFNGFDASGYVPPSFGVLPKGWYRAEMKEAGFEPTKSGGMMIKATFEITFPEFAKGRKVWARYNIVNANEEAQRIGYEQLSALSYGVGVLQWQTPEQLLNRPLNLRLKVVDGKGEYEDSNEPNGYALITDNVKYAMAPTGQAPAGAAPAMAMPSAAVAMPFPAAQQPAANPFPAQAAPAAQPFPAAQPQAAAQPFPAQPAAQPVAQQPTQPAQPAVDPNAAASAPWAGAAQPWANPQQGAVAPQQAAQPAQVAQPAAQPMPEASAQPAWATAQAVAGQEVAQAAAPQPAAAEPAHPAQAAVPPWQQPAQ
ncbi:hypothetical protein [Hafnia phage yong3]|nr:hypothetical protein [Hafnia phage yong3]